MTPFNRSIFVLFRLTVCAFLLTLLFHPSAGCSTIHSGQKADTSTPSTSEQIDREQQSLLVSSDYDELSQNPELLERILEGPHGYLRFINALFAEAVCARFQDDLGGIPKVNLYNDAHLENYAITERGRGLTDFDDATIGPMVLDLVRFGVSMHLACRANGWEDKAEGMVDSFLSSYGAALKNPGLTIPPPEVVAQIRARFTTERERALAAKQKLMEPLGEPLENFEASFKQYTDQMKVQHPDLPSYFFDIKKAGRLKIGIGSALDEKYLLRVEGTTKVDEDDVILEIKEVKDLRGISCIQLRKAIPMRPIVMQARLAYEPYRYTGSIVLGLNDALVELTGALAGLTLALQDTKLIALTGSITGIAAALSMGASEYLSTKSEDVDRSPVKASTPISSERDSVPAPVLPFSSLTVTWSFTSNVIVSIRSKGMVASESPSLKRKSV